MFIALRDKVEHRYERALKAAASGRAHALVINFEHELVRALTAVLDTDRSAPA